MQQKMSRFDTAVETFMDSSGLSRGEAEVYVLRKIDSFGRQEAARRLDKEPSTVDTLLQRAMEKEPTLPAISEVRYPDTTNGVETEAATISFENGAMLRYALAEHEDGSIELREETVGANDPHSVLDSYVVGGEGDDVAEFALESISEYTRSYRNPEACRKDWPSVFEALTLYQA